jgi:hypothetical protein
VAINWAIIQVSRMKAALLPLRLNELFGGVEGSRRIERRHSIIYFSIQAA